MLTGGCFCGAVRYEAKGDVFHSTLCHCSDCRHVAAAPAVAWFSVAVPDFRITAGTPRRFKSSPDVERGFCGDCGTGLTYRHDGRPEIDITTCSLDAPETIPPADHSFVRSRLSWIGVADGLPEYDTVRRD